MGCAHKENLPNFLCQHKFLYFLCKVYLLESSRNLQRWKMWQKLQFLYRSLEAGYKSRRNSGVKKWPTAEIDRFTTWHKGKAFFYNSEYTKFERWVLVQQINVSSASSLAAYLLLTSADSKSDLSLNKFQNSKMCHMKMLISRLQNGTSQIMADVPVALSIFYIQSVARNWRTCLLPVLNMLFPISLICWKVDNVAD